MRILNTILLPCCVLALCLNAGARAADEGPLRAEAPPDLTSPKKRALEEALKTEINLDFKDADLAWVAETVFTLTGARVLVSTEAMSGHAITIRATDLTLRELLAFIDGQFEDMTVVIGYEAIWLKPLNTKDVARSLAAALDDATPQVRADALQALKALGKPATAELQKALEHKRADVRSGAARMLGAVWATPAAK